MALKLSVEIQAITKDAIDRLDKLRTKMNELGKSGLVAREELGSVSGKLAEIASRAKSATDSVANGGRRAAQSLAPVTAQLSGIRGQLLQLVSGAAVLQSFRQFVTVTDQVSNLNAQLRLATKNSQELATAQSVVTDIANQFGVRVTDVASSFARLSQALAGIGGGLREAAALTEALSAATILSGASAVEAAASMTQFSQALGSGVLQGDELRSILENNRRLAKALADGLGVTVGELKKLGEAGELSAERVAKAVISQLGVLRAEAEAVPDTVERAGNRLSNAFLTWVSASQEAANAQQNLIGLINSVSENIGSLVRVVQIAGTVIIGLFAGRAIQAIASFVASIGTAITAIRTAGIGIAALSGPIGIVLGLLSAIAAGFLLFGNNAADAHEKALEGANKYIEALRRQNDLQREQAGLQAQSVTKLSKSTEEFVRLTREAQRLRELIKQDRSIAESVDPNVGTTQTSSLSKNLQQLAVVERTIQELATELQRAKDVKFFESEEASAKKFATEVRAAGKEFFTLAEQFQTEAEKNQETIKKLRDLGRRGEVRPEIIEKTVARVGQKRSPSGAREEERISGALAAFERSQIENQTRLQSDQLSREERQLRESFERRELLARDFYTRLATIQKTQITTEINEQRALLLIEERRRDDPNTAQADRIRSETEILRIKREIEIQTRKISDVDAEANQAIVTSNKEVASSLEDVRFKLKEVSGTSTLEDIRKNILKGRQELLDSLEGDEAGQLDVLKLVNVEAVQQRLTDFQSQAEQVLSNLAIKQEDIQTRLSIGSITSTEAERELNAERQRSSVEIQAIVRNMEALKDVSISAFGPEQLAAIEQLKTKLGELKVTTDETSRRMRQSFQSSLSDLFVDLIKDIRNAEDAMKKFADAVINAFIRIAAEKAAAGILEGLGSLFGGTQSSGIGLSAGGMVHGPGTTTSDSIPARLSRDEFVVKAATVQKVGPRAMYALNSGQPKIIEALKDATRRLNTGGRVGDAPGTEKIVEREFRQKDERSKEKSGFVQIIRERIAAFRERPEQPSAAPSVVVVVPGAERRTEASARDSVTSVQEASNWLRMSLRAVAASSREIIDRAFGRDQISNQHAERVSDKLSQRLSDRVAILSSDRKSDRASDRTSILNRNHTEILSERETTALERMSDVSRGVAKSVNATTARRVEESLRAKTGESDNYRLVELESRSNADKATEALREVAEYATDASSVATISALEIEGHTSNGSSVERTSERTNSEQRSPRVSSAFARVAEASRELIDRVLGRERTTESVSDRTEMYSDRENSAMERVAHVSQTIAESVNVNSGESEIHDSVTDANSVAAIHVSKEEKSKAREIYAARTSEHVTSQSRLSQVSSEIERAVDASQVVADSVSATTDRLIANSASVTTNSSIKDAAKITIEKLIADSASISLEKSDIRQQSERESRSSTNRLTALTASDRAREKVATTAQSREQSITESVSRELRETAERMQSAKVVDRHTLHASTMEVIRQAGESMSESVESRAERETAERTTTAIKMFSHLSKMISERIFNAPRLLMERYVEKSKEQKLSVGGIVQGGGTTTSDSISARLSRNEFVVKASTVEKVGADVMYALNAGHPRIVEALRTAASGVQNFVSNVSMAPSVPRIAFADGGLVSTNTTTVANEPKINFVVQTQDAGSFVKSRNQIMQEFGRAIRAAQSRA